MPVGLPSQVASAGRIPIFFCHFIFLSEISFFLYLPLRQILLHLPDEPARVAIQNV